ncbi:MAG: NADPH:quinone oxidoreductase family protein [Herpetosiphon sp.]
MLAWEVREWCEPEQMRLVETPVPVPGPGEVCVRTYAAALNFFDILQIAGKYQVRPPLPFTPGAEIAGVIHKLGLGVRHLSLGDRVQALPSSGGFAEYALAPAEKTFRIPDALPFTEAAACLLVYQTAFFALTTRGRLQNGEWLLVHAAAGGVGLASVQIGQALGARVIATASSQAKLDLCLSNGAEHALDYGQESWIQQVKDLTLGKGADVIIDPVGGDVFDGSTKCIAPAGRILVIGFAGGRIPSIAANRILLKNMSVMGCYWGGYVDSHPEYLRDTQQILLQMYTAGQIKPVVGARYPLHELVPALRALGNRETVGKVIVNMETL